MDYAEGGDLQTMIKKKKESGDEFDESTVWKFLN